MKQITFELPTSWKDIKTIIKRKSDRRYEHNREVITKLYRDMLKRIYSNYWSNDVSEYFRENFEYNDTNGCKGLLHKALNELK